MKGKTYYVGISYSVAMLVFYCVPQEITYPYLLGIFVAGTMMCLLERRNIKQKVFLATIIYLFRWMVYGVTLVLRDIMFALFINTSYMLTEPVKQWRAYILVELAELLQDQVLGEIGILVLIDHNVVETSCD